MSETKTSASESVARVCIEGELTIYRAGELKTVLLDTLKQGRLIEVDLASVSELDSAGVQLLLLVKRQADLEDKQLRFTRHSAAVLEVFELANLSGPLGVPNLQRASESSE